jgi:hypothetical protein
MSVLKKKVLPSLLPIIVVVFVLTGAVFLAVFATQASSWPGAATTTLAPTTTATAESTTTTTAKVEFKTFLVNMTYEAGAAQYKTWTAGRVIHAGIGWFEPFGRSEYVAGMGFPEAAEFPKPAFMADPSWSSVYPTGLFCIYMTKYGNIIAYDGIVGNLHKVENDDGKMDCLINVVVGGTGIFKGCNGMLIGRTPGRGASSDVGGGLLLPVSILKLMEGYINVPVDQLPDELK